MLFTGKLAKMNKKGNVLSSCDDHDSSTASIYNFFNQTVKL